MSGMKSEINFRVTYDGPELVASQMDIAHLAPALLALSALLKEANATLNGDKATVNVAVQGGFRQGSFGIELLIQQDLLQQVVNLFKGDEAAAFANAKAVLEVVGFLGGGAYGLVALLKKIRGRKVDRIEPRPEGVALITAEETIIVDRATGLLYTNRKLRTHLKDALSPLANGVATRFFTGMGNACNVEIAAEDLPWFEPAQTTEIIADDTTRVTLLLESPVFKEGNKWRFSDGTTSFHAELVDADFLARVNAGEERFGKGDILVVRLQRIQSIADGRLSSDYRVIEVIEHREPLQRHLI